MGTVILNGSHGTSRKRAIMIMNKGFNSSPCGDLGKGAYFWGDEEYLKELGEAWAKYRLSQKVYKNDETLAVLFVEIETHKESLLDYKDIKKLAIREMKRSHIDASDKGKCSKFIDTIIQGIEKEMGTGFQVLKGEIPLPPRKHFCKSFPYGMMTTATCYVVRDLNAVTVESMRKI